MPGLYVVTKKKRPDIIATREMLNSSGVCRKCGLPYTWKVGHLRNYEHPQNLEQQEISRAFWLFMEYQQQHIGPCCAKPEHRNFIAKHAGMAFYA